MSRESTILADVREEFLGCKAQCVSFLATSLSNPDMFGRKSENAVTDLSQVMAEDTTPAVATMLRELAEELDEQEMLPQVVQEIVQKCYDSLAVVVPDMSMNPMAMMQVSLSRTLKEKGCFGISIYCWHLLSFRVVH